MSIKAVIAAAALLAVPALLTGTANAADYRGDGRGDRTYSRDHDDDAPSYRGGNRRAPTVVIVAPPGRGYDRYDDRRRFDRFERRRHFGYGRPWWARNHRYAERHNWGPRPYPRHDW